MAADDKMMFKKDWKSPEFNLERRPFINKKWLIRVLLWRFLEITSRIGILCLMWINLGGISVFIVLPLEIMYLSIICFGLGTLSDRISISQ